MSLYFNTDDRVHIERVNAERSERRGIFINVQPSVDDNAKKHSEHQTPSFIHLRNNLNISPGERRREAFTKSPLKKVREIKQCLGNKSKGKEKNFAITFVLCKLQIIFLQSIISDCLKPIYNILRAFGVFPLSRQGELSEFRFYVQSPAMAYSFAVFVVLIVSSCAMLFLFM
jgi:hypothetical protein